jgi:hypothetical protein
MSARSAEVTTAVGSAPVTEFEIARGGPFYELQRRARLLEERALAAGRRAVLAVALAWGVPLVVSALEGHAVGPVAGRPFLADFGAWARFAIGIAIFFAMERMVEERLRGLHRRMVAAAILPPGQRAEAAEAALRAMRRRDSGVAEAVCCLIAIGVSIFAAMHVDATSPGWLAQPSETGFRLTAAGWWCVLVSNPLFLFLILRWSWRHLVWGLLLRDIARLDLRLVASHPDGSGGLAFIGDYPNAFAAFVFALSCAVAAPLAYGMLRGGTDLKVWGQVMGAWLIVVAVAFAFPLAAFVAPLARLRAETLAAASALATRRERAVERDTLGRNIMAAQDADTSSSAEMPDPSKCYAAARKLSIFPLRKTALLPVGIAALLPMVAVGATQLPLRELLKVARGLLL